MPCHKRGWIRLIEMTASNTTPRSPTPPAFQPASLPVNLPGQEQGQIDSPVQHATHDLESGSGHLAFNVGQ